MSYLNAPQTELVATNCAVCARPLCDSVSVETGIGPICREKFGYYGSDPEAQVEANALVHKIAIDQTGPDVNEAIARLRALGFEKLAARITKRIAGRALVKIAPVAGGFEVETPYHEEAIAAWRCVPGRRWIADKKANFVPATAKGDLWALLVTYFNGVTAEGPKGIFVIA